MSNGILVATHGALVTFDGQERVIKPGDTVREGHPILLGREALFALLRPTYEYLQEVEPETVPPEAEAPKPSVVASATPKPEVVTPKHVAHAKPKSASGATAAKPETH